MTNNDPRPSYDQLFGEDVPPPKYEDIFGGDGQGPPPSQNENQAIEIEIPASSQNENPTNRLPSENQAGPQWIRIVIWIITIIILATLFTVWCVYAPFFVILMPILILILMNIFCEYFRSKQDFYDAAGFE